VSQVAVDKIDETKAATASVFDELNTVSEGVRRRAFEIFERRGSDGCAVDDWLRAERDLLWIPESEFVERGAKFDIRLSAPGFDPGDIHVVALGDALIVKAASTHTHSQTEGNVLHFCEFGQKTLFRRFELPEPINLDKVTANLEKGILHLTALMKSASPTMAASFPI